MSDPSSTGQLDDAFVDRTNVAILDNESYELIYQFDGVNIPIPDEGEVITFGEADLFSETEGGEMVFEGDRHVVTRRMFSYQKIAAEVEVEEVKLDEEQIVSHIFLYVEPTSGDFL